MVHGVPMEIPPKPVSSLSRSLGRSATASSLLSSATPTRSFVSSRTIGSGMMKSKSSSAKWVNKANQVLAFNAYFKEAVHERAGENFRVRKCVIYFYMEDETIQIIEHKAENSGIPQGNFVKRHQVPKAGSSGEMYTLDDLQLGACIHIYGRQFFIVDCNKSTREYLQKERSPEMLQASGYPDDPYESQRSEFMLRETGADFTVARNMRKSDMKKFMEATLGNTVNNRGLEGFLKYNGGRDVLRFDCVWDDRSAMFGDLQKYTLHYFLSDSTIEILERPRPNSGRDPFPKLLKRMQLPRMWRTEDANGRSDEPSVDAFYRHTDFYIGARVNCYNRQLVITDADESTRKFYEALGMPLSEPQFVPEDETRRTPAQDPPPYNGWGNEKDSLASCVSLIPKAPKTQFDIHGPKLDKQVLRFSGHLETNNVDDVDRKFVIQFFCSDNTISVREPPQRNSGVIGGNYLVQMQHKNPETGKTYEQQDFYVGARVVLSRRTFIITDVDEHTLKHMEKMPALFPYSNAKAVLSGLRKKLQHEARAGALTQLFRKYDRDLSGKITIDEFASCLRGYDADLPDQAVVTLMRQFDKKGTGVISANEFVDVIMRDDSKDIFDEADSNNDQMYMATAQAAANAEKMELTKDAVLAFFTDEFLNKEHYGNMLIKMDESGTGILPRDAFIRGISVADKTSDATSPNIYLTREHAEIIAQEIYGDDEELAFSQITQKISNINLNVGSRGHQSLHREGDGGV